MNMHNGNSTTCAMNTLSSKIYSLPGMTTDSSIEDITSILEQMRASYEEIKSASTMDRSSDGTLTAFSNLSKHKPDIMNDLPSLASKLQMLKEKLLAHESNNLSHLAAVLASKLDISSLTSLSVGMFDDENDRAIFANLSEKHGTELLKMLKDKRAQQLAGRKGRDGFGNLVDSGNLVHISMMTRCYGCSALKELASLMVCGGCRVNKYCSRDCQVAHWREHSKSCHHYSNQRNVTSKPNSTYETGKKPQTSQG